MFSSLRSKAAAHGPWTLRTRLIASILVLMAGVLAVIGLVTTVVMREQLVRQLDEQLMAASDRSQRYGDRPPPTGGERPNPINAPGQGAGTIVARIVDNQVTLPRQIDTTGVTQSLSAADSAALAHVPVDGRPHSVDLGSLGDYRAIAISGSDGDVWVTALPLDDVDDTILDLIAVEVGVAVLGLLLAGMAGVTIVRLSLRSLQRVAATAGRVAELPLAQGEVDLSVRVPDEDTDPRTEVGQVGLAFNRMLGHVASALELRHASETRVRQFVADASHELRTPLAAIRGYAELTRRSRAAVPPDVAHALSRVESESARMTTLVDDLLLLARLDSGRPLARADVDLSRLIVDAVSDAHAAGPDHRWLLDLPENVVTVPGDSARLHQVLGNLLANARTHTPPGTTVTTTLRTEADQAVIAVVDDGPGIPDDLQHEVFERFARGDSSRSRAAGSTGLGLAIVAAVIEAHRGEVSVTSEPGRTAFEVRLPEATQATSD